MVLQAYFDESERVGGTFCVAGYAFAPEQAKKFKKQWSRLFPDGFHMVDLVHARKQFKGISPRDTGKLLCEAVKIINTRVSLGVAISCKLAELNAYSPKNIRGFGHAYPVCCHMAMVAVGKYLRSSGNDDRVAYFFEDGHAHEAEAREFMKRCCLLPELKESYRHASDTFLPKKDAVQLGAADLPCLGVG